jgi:hypothetical protein
VPNSEPHFSVSPRQEVDFYNKIPRRMPAGILQCNHIDIASLRDNASIEMYGFILLVTYQFNENFITHHLDQACPGDRTEGGYFYRGVYA